MVLVGLGPSESRIVEEFGPEVQIARSWVHQYLDSFVKCSLTQAEMDRIRRDYRIPNALECRVPGPDETVISVRVDETTFYTYFIKLGFRLPFTPSSASSLGTMGFALFSSP